MSDLLFLTIEDVKEIQEEQIQLYGGSSGIRDEGLLKSAVAMPQMGFSGQHLHVTLFDKASAYGYHITQNHPFVDGNKRTGLASALIFLKVNDIEVNDPEEKLEQAMQQLASGGMTKQDLSKLFEELATQKDP